MQSISRIQGKPPKIRRIIYLGIVTTESYGRTIGEKVFSGAAERKMKGVTRAMRSVGLRAILLSVPFVGKKAHRSFYWRPVVLKDEGSPSVFLATARNAYLRKVLAAIALLLFSIRSVRASDRILVYNHAVEFLPALLWLKAAGVRIYLDIEDAPGAHETGMRGFLSRLSFAITFRLAEQRKMVVANHVAEALNLQDPVVVRGISSYSREASSWQTSKWRGLRSGGDLRLHFGGTLSRDTGVDLFYETVVQLATRTKELKCPVYITVTGVGESDKIRRLSSILDANGFVHLKLMLELSRAEFDREISSCHASLSLRMPGSHMSKRTFPSKVVEITAAGLALISTDGGDVTSLFNHENAFLVSAYTPNALIDVIVKMTEDASRVERVAKAGYDLCRQVFSLRAVGIELHTLFHP